MRTTGLHKIIEMRRGYETWRKWHSCWFRLFVSSLPFPVQFFWTDPFLLSIFCLPLYLILTTVTSPNCSRKYNSETCFSETREPWLQGQIYAKDKLRCEYFLLEEIFAVEFSLGLLWDARLESWYIYKRHSLIHY